MSHQKPYWRRPHRRPKASSRANRPILNSANRKADAEKHSRNASAWIGKAKLSRPSIAWCRTNPSPSAIEKTAQFVKEKPARLATGVRQPPAPLTPGQGNRGERSNKGAGSRGLDNSGAMNGESGSRAGRK